MSAAPEKKFIDLAQTLTVGAATSTGLLSAPLNAIAQGTDAKQHIGRQITMRSLYWTWRGALSTTATGSTAVRLLIVYDKESEAGAPSIYVPSASDIVNQDNINAKMNLDNRDRFIVLLDEVVETLSQAGPLCFYRKGYRKVQLPVVFNSINTATIGAIQTGGVYAVMWSDGNLVAGSMVSVLDTRIRFVDN